MKTNKLILSFAILFVALNFLVPNTFADDENIVEASLNSSSLTVTGTITDSTDGEPLPGTTVKVKYATTNALSDLDGEYQITVNEPATLLFIRIGYISQEISVNNRSVINVAMVPEPEPDKVGSIINRIIQFIF